MVFEKVTELIGNTPLIKISHDVGTILGKCEFLNPSHSIKDRASIAMIKNALETNKINQNTLIIEPTSGNTGIALSMICASLRLQAIFTMPSSMSIERQKLLKAYGAKIVLTEPSLGMQGAVQKALELAKDNPNSFIPSQFENVANPNMHYKTTALEIWNSTQGKIDAFIAGFGTGGTISGVGKFLKEKNPQIKIIAIEPKDSPLVSQKRAGSHKIQGIGANFVPKNLDLSVIDEIITISNEDAINSTLHLARNDGLLVGISSGANVFVAKQLIKSHQVVVTMLNDTGERYLSTGIFD
ncbi:cysteine synthase A [Helicobacter cetorum]|uniref:cysteine synthase A n=1 Tax=Helicobacter cetorum TaxID=138563 RepID=UPI000CF1B4AE|nr:cysteine synthase A [Helicobacter cetorum]